MKNFFLFFMMIILSSIAFGQQNLNNVTDIDGNVYKTVTIGSQVWMASNLKTTKYRNGNLIGTSTPATLNISEESAPKYQWAINGNERNVATYGRLYTWYAATDSRGICPTGWHLPTDAEWTTLTTYLGGKHVAGDILKEAGTSHWQSPNSGATNSSSFTALPGGYRDYDGTFYSVGTFGYWWSSTEHSTGVAEGRYMHYVYNDVRGSYAMEMNGFSLRCIKGEGDTLTTKKDIVAVAKVTDIDGNVYKTVTIGSQVWMKENLKTTKYRNGNSIGTTTPATLDITSQTNPKYQWAYDGNESNVATYGRLYTWYAATDWRGICPTGWHVPTDAEWTTLITFIGGDYVAGDILKEAGTSHWQSPNRESTNSRGFTALPGGLRMGNGTFIIVGYTGKWWSSTGSFTDNAWYRTMEFEYGQVGRNDRPKADGHSVRCVRDN